jgi:hypothetical protein
MLWIERRSTSLARMTVVNDMAIHPPDPTPRALPKFRIVGHKEQRNTNKPELGDNQHR